MRISLECSRANAPTSQTTNATTSMRTSAVGGTMPNERPKTHPDVEYAVDDCSGRERVFKTPDEAAGFAVSIAMSGRPNVSIDVLVYTREGAIWYHGSSAGGDEYDEDPEASIFDRIVIKAESIGRVA